MHGRSKEDTWRLSEAFEPTPPFYAALDLGTLLGRQKSSAKGGAGAKGEIREVEMEGEEDGAVDAGSGGEEEGGAGRTTAVSSRWAALEDEQGKEAGAGAGERGQRAGKRGKAAGEGGKAAGSGGGDGAAVDDWRELLSRQQQQQQSGLQGPDGGAGGGAAAEAEAPRKPRSILSRSWLDGSVAGGSGRRVRWPDQAEEEAAAGGFKIGGLSQQLETVYVVQGLGPSGGEGGGPRPTQQAFGDAAKADRRREGVGFRNILLGRGGAA